MSNLLQHKTLRGGGKLLGLILCLLVVLFSCENRSVQPSTLEVVVNDTLSGLSKTIQPDESVLGDSKGIDAYRIVVTPDNSTSSVADTGVVSKGCDMLLDSVAPGDYAFTVSGYINGHLVAKTDNDITISGSETSVTLALKDIASGNAGDLTLDIYLPYDCSGYDAVSTITVTFTDGNVYKTTFSVLTGHITEGSDDSGDYIKVVIPSGEAVWTTDGVALAALPAGIGEMVLSLSYDGETAESRAYCTLWSGVGLTGSMDMRSGEDALIKWQYINLPENSDSLFSAGFSQVAYGNGCFALVEESHLTSEHGSDSDFAMYDGNEWEYDKVNASSVGDLAYGNGVFVSVSWYGHEIEFSEHDGLFYGDNISGYQLGSQNVDIFVPKAGDPTAVVGIFSSPDGKTWTREYRSDNNIDDNAHALLMNDKTVFFQYRLDSTDYPAGLYSITRKAKNTYTLELVTTSSPPNDDTVWTFYVKNKEYVMFGKNESGFKLFCRNDSSQWQQIDIPSAISSLIITKGDPNPYKVSPFFKSDGNLLVCIGSDGDVVYTTDGNEWVQSTKLEVGTILDFEYFDKRFVVLGTEGIAYFDSSSAV